MADYGAKSITSFYSKWLEVTKRAVGQCRRKKEEESGSINVTLSSGAAGDKDMDPEVDYDDIALARGTVNGSERAVKGNVEISVGDISIETRSHGSHNGGNEGEKRE